MPRPGPRPYECVRRAWHSDRHQPMRGSIISRLFWVVTETHGASTRENREWQEKLPTVVLRAEEIMYSKANSEAEYLDTGTLWDRLNDAIDTIIRKEETAETGEYLQPCIEAALVLGCVPVRASRSQRLCNPRNYLHRHVQESASRDFALSEQPINERQRLHCASVAPCNQLSIASPAVVSQQNEGPILDSLAREFALSGRPVNERQQLHRASMAHCNQLCIARPAVVSQQNEVPILDSRARDFALSGQSVNGRRLLHHTSMAPSTSSQLSIARPAVVNQQNEVPVLGSRTIQSTNHVAVNDVERNVMPTPATPIESNHSMKRSFVYPLNYGPGYQDLSSRSGIQMQNATNVIVGRPIGWSSAQPSQYCTTRELFPSVGGACSSNKCRQENQAETIGVGSVIGCDLSLRLGRAPDPPSIQWEYEVGASGTSSPQNPKISFPPVHSSNDPLEPCSIRWVSEGEVRDGSTALRKR